MNKATNKSKVMLNLIQHLQRELLSFKNGVRGRSRIKYGMTSLFNNSKAFTLIELLVVVLIIGILAAVALPQYQKAVAKSRATQLISASKQIKDAQQAYHLANNTYATDFDELGLEIGTISYDKSRETFQFGYCSIVENSDRVSCFLSTPHIVFQRFYATERIFCCAYPNDNFKGDEICQSLSNKKSWSNGCSEGTPCHCYLY